MPTAFIAHAEAFWVLSPQLCNGFPQSAVQCHGALGVKLKLMDGHGVGREAKLQCLVGVEHAWFTSLDSNR